MLRAVAVAEPVQSFILDEASHSADSDEYDSVFDEPAARVYDGEAVLCARALARSAPADFDAHLMCAPPDILVSD